MTIEGFGLEFDFSNSEFVLVHPNGNNTNTNKVRRSRISSHKVKVDNEPEVCKFFKKATEDILWEIFLRLGNSRYATRLSLVCRHWHSLISHPQFIPRFIRLHPYYERSACTFLFYKAQQSTYDRYYQQYQPEEPVCKIFSNESLFLNGKHATSSSSYCDFIPNPYNTPIVINASFNDLLLVHNRDKYVICNPVTKRWFEVPNVPSVPYVPYELGTVTSSICCGNVLLANNNVLKVVKIYREHLADGNHQIKATVFCCESRQWSHQCFPYPQPTNATYKVVAVCNGIMYWRDGSHRVLALDLFDKQSCGVIYFPQVDLGAKLRLGVVMGELRLLSFRRTRPGTRKCFVIKIWELDHRDNSWVLVHERNLSDQNAGKKMYCIAFHPENCDVIFMVWGMRVYEYRVSKGFFHKLGELQESIGDIGDHDLQCFALVHPAWPTPVPSHPPSI